MSIHVIFRCDLCKNEGGKILDVVQYPNHAKFDPDQPVRSHVCFDCIKIVRQWSPEEMQKLGVETAKV